MQLSGLGNSVDFVLAFAMVHEMPDAASFFREAAETMRPGARMLLAEPSGHVSEEDSRPDWKWQGERGSKWRRGRQFAEAAR
jgi:hypothetical protein